MFVGDYERAFPPYFLFQSIPSLCSINPVSATYASTVSFTGINFGATQGMLIFGGHDADRMISWNTIASPNTASGTVPNLRTGSSQAWSKTVVIIPVTQLIFLWKMLLVNRLLLMLLHHLDQLGST